MEAEKEPCSFAHACVNPGPRQRLAGTDLYFCGPHYQAVHLPSHAGETAGELGGSRVQFASPGSRGRKRGWSLGVATTGSWM